VRRVFGHDRPHEIGRLIGYLPEERGLYPSMKAIEAIAFMGALRGLSLAEGRKRGMEMLERHGLAHAATRQIRQLSKGMAQTVQLLGTLVHRPRLVVLDEPFSGLDAINQGKLEAMIRALADDGVTVIFSTHVIHHAERLCEGVAIIAGGRVPYAGSVEAARDRIPAQVRLETRAREGAWLAALPKDTRRNGDFFHFPLPESGVEPLLRQLIEGEAGILSLSIERAGLHDAFVAIAGEAAARALKADTEGAAA
jgi:ABC-2 type transport system ATP-binding protein